MKQKKTWFAHRGNQPEEITEASGLEVEWTEDLWTTGTETRRISSENGFIFGVAPPDSTWPARVSEGDESD
jgi:hypothetical protein